MEDWPKAAGPAIADVAEDAEVRCKRPLPSVLNLPLHVPLSLSLMQLGHGSASTGGALGIDSTVGRPRDVMRAFVDDVANDLIVIDQNIVIDHNLVSGN